MGSTCEKENTRDATLSSRETLKQGVQTPAKIIVQYNHQTEALQAAAVAAAAYAVSDDKNGYQDDEKTNQVLNNPMSTENNAEDLNAMDRLGEKVPSKRWKSFVKSLSISDAPAKEADIQSTLPPVNDNESNSSELQRVGEINVRRGEDTKTDTREQEKMDTIERRYSNKIGKIESWKREKMDKAWAKKLKSEIELKRKMEKTKERYESDIQLIDRVAKTAEQSASKGRINDEVKVKQKVDHKKCSPCI